MHGNKLCFAIFERNYRFDKISRTVLVKLTRLKLSVPGSWTGVEVVRGGFTRGRQRKGELASSSTRATSASVSSRLPPQQQQRPPPDRHRRVGPGMAARGSGEAAAAFRRRGGPGAGRRRPRGDGIPRVAAGQVPEPSPRRCGTSRMDRELSSENGKRKQRRETDERACTVTAEAAEVMSMMKTESLPKMPLLTTVQLRTCKVHEHLPLWSVHDQRYDH